MGRDSSLSSLFDQAKLLNNSKLTRTVSKLTLPDVEQVTTATPDAAV